MSNSNLETGSAKLVRHHMYNNGEDDIDVPDGDVEYGRNLYNAMCAGYLQNQS